MSTSTPSNPKAVFAPGITALITGAASGIGLALATKCASYGMNVLIVDNNGPNLALAQKSVAGTAGAGKIETFEMDVSKLEDFEGLREKVVKDYGGTLHLLALNAGIGGSGTWGDASYFQRILSTNLFGVINGLNTLLPLVTSSSSPSSPSSVIITGSKQGITNPPGNPAYNASKSAVKTLAEHLSHDLSLSHPSVSVHLLIPGWTFTGLSGNSPSSSTPKKGKPPGAWLPEQVVEYLEQKMAEGKFYVVCPDNDVTEEMDRRRMLWDRLDLVEGRPPLTRWRGGWKEAADEGMQKLDI